MDDTQNQLDLYKAAIRENMVTVICAVACVVLVAFATKSLHCFWGLLVLMNLNIYRMPSRRDRT